MLSKTDLDTVGCPKKEFSTFGEIFSRVCKEKNLNNYTLARKLEITTVEVENLKKCRGRVDSYGEKEEKKLDEEFLKKVSGVIGILYSDLLIASGYSVDALDSFKTDFYNEEGIGIDIISILTKLYYKDPEHFKTNLVRLINE